MTRRTARFLTRLYPPAWRARYGEEFQAFLESRSVQLTEILSTVGSALSERFMGALPIILYASVAAFAAGGSLYLAASGALVIQALDAHRALWLSWAVIEASSLATVAVGVAAVAPVVFRMLRKPNWEILGRLALPVGAGSLLVLWLYVIGEDARSVAGIWTTVLGLGTLVEQMAGFLKYVIAHSELPQSVGRRRLVVLAMASSIMVMTVSSASYGLMFNFLVTDGFRFAGPYAFWTIFLGTLAFRVAPGVKSARRCSRAT